MKTSRYMSNFEKARIVSLLVNNMKYEDNSISIDDCIKRVDKQLRNHEVKNLSIKRKCFDGSSETINVKNLIYL